MIQKKKTTMILVGKNLVGLVGLDEIFQKFSDLGKTPDDSLKDELLCEAKKQNYIPAKMEKDYQEALLREYESFYTRKRKGEKTEQEEAGETYQGVPRDAIPWFPTVYEEKCDGCKDCFDMCPTQVYLWDEKTQKPKVVHPLSCVVGCSGCADICKLKAISFPPKSIIDNILKRR